MPAFLAQRQKSVFVVYTQMKAQARVALLVEKRSTMERVCMRLAGHAGDREGEGEDCSATRMPSSRPSPQKDRHVPPEHA